MHGCVISDVVLMYCMPKLNPEGPQGAKPEQTKQVAWLRCKGL